MDSPREIILFGPRMAPFTEKVRRGLVLKGLQFELREPTSLEDYSDWSPETGLLPVMTIDGELTSDSTEILFTLDRLYPDPPLLSRDPVIAEQQRSLEDWADESFLWYFMKLLNFRGQPPITTPDLEQLQSAAQEDRENDKKTFRWLRQFRAWLSAVGTWERPETSLLRGLSDRLGDLANFLGARAFFYAERVSIADLAVYSMLLTMRRDAIPGSQQLLSNHPTLVEFMRRVERETGG